MGFLSAGAVVAVEVAVDTLQRRERARNPAERHECH
jgi:hypothetical protein